jgi:hypothetical protein
MITRLVALEDGYPQAHTLAWVIVVGQADTKRWRYERQRVIIFV